MIGVIIETRNRWSVCKNRNNENYDYDLYFIKLKKEEFVIYQV